MRPASAAAGSLAYPLAVDLTEPVSPIERWALSPDVVHLNHGSFGGCPRAVIDAAAAWRTKLESAPMRFLVLEWQRELDRARAALAAFVRAPEARTAFVPSSTTGVAIALHSIAPGLAAGDEVLVTDHTYRSCRNQLERLATARGLRIATVHVPLPFDATTGVESKAPGSSLVALAADDTTSTISSL